MANVIFTPSVRKQAQQKEPARVIQITPEMVKAAHQSTLVKLQMETAMTMQLAPHQDLEPIRASATKASRVMAHHVIP